MSEIKIDLKNERKLTSSLRINVTEVIKKRFSILGYDVHIKVLNAADYGVPQKRQRVFIVGFKFYEDFAYFNFPSETTLNDSMVPLNTVIDSDANQNEKWFFITI